MFDVELYQKKKKHSERRKRLEIVRKRNQIKEIDVNES